MASLVVFMSDFGLRDPYVAQVKAVIKSRFPLVEVLDLCHEVPAFCISCASYMLYSSFKWFPEDTVFLSVIDPGVGSGRRALACRSFNRFFIAPDNGLLWQILSEDEESKAFVIDEELIGAREVSYTFHGRDIFAPAAAKLALTKNLYSVGYEVPVESLVKLSIKSVCREDDFECFRVIHVDRFGNTVLSAMKNEYKLPEYGSKVLVKTGDKLSEAVVERTFSRVKEGELAIYYNSFNFIELGVFMGSASEKMGVRVGDKVCIKRI